MAEEVKHNFVTGKTLYFCRFILSNSNVMLANPATNEVWGTGARDASAYGVAMTEEGGSGHYTGDFADGGAIAAGTYHIVVYDRLTGAFIDSDPALAQGDLPWDGTSEINLFAVYTDTNEIQGKLPDEFIMGSSVTDSMDDEINAAVQDLGQVKTIEDESPGDGAPDRTSGIVKGF
ncbi:hypothetical protein LCGC14_0376730 [marine sediment metagenome]|uniref:Uncharacterized protein n=1 Tax=marine sediment metagenome TaxID=412755 RepID=A0A0F9TLM9_9ZZZZ